MPISVLVVFQVPFWMVFVVHMLIPRQHLKWLCIIFDPQWKYAFKAPNFHEYIIINIIYHLCYFCTCSSVSFHFQTWNKIVYFSVNFVIMVWINFKIFVILDLSCLLAHLFVSSIVHCSLFGNFSSAAVIFHSLVFLIVQVFCMVLQRNWIST